MNKLKRIPGCGYKLLGYFSSAEDACWTEYYGPMERRVQELRMKCVDDPEALDALARKQNEINVLKKNPESCGSVFFVMQKI
jgi:hypothetical protein